MSENKNIEKPTNFIFEGNIAVKACIESKHRIVSKVMVDEKKHDRDTNYIVALAHRNNIPVIKCCRDEIEILTQGKTHGGLIAFVQERIYQEITFDYDFYALVEGIEDPYNFAQVLRSLWAAGCKCVLVSKRNWNVASDILARTSAGASEKIDMVQFDSFTDVLKLFKQHHYEIVCAQRKNAVSLFEHQFKLKTLLCIGGEMRGLSKEVAENSDVNVFIPYGNDFKNALTSVSATSVMAFEYVRQTMKK